jgi:hypothetical protein
MKLTFDIFDRREPRTVMGLSVMPVRHSSIDAPLLIRKDVPDSEITDDAVTLHHDGAELHRLDQ